MNLIIYKLVQIIKKKNKIFKSQLKKNKEILNHN
jgi:hypothetical protein